MKKYLPHLVALGIFLLFTVLYCSPVFFGGKELRQSDINNWKGMSKEIVDFKEKTGEDTYWTNSMFGGMPGYQISANYTGNLVRYFDTIFTLGLPAPANFIFLFLAGFYFLLITLKVDSRLAIAGSIGFSLSLFFILAIITGHNSKVHAIGYMAPIIAGIIMTYQGRYLLGAALTTLFLALQLYANHLQITYYLMLAVLIYVGIEFYLSIKGKRIAGFVKASVLLCFGAVLAVMTSITSLCATQEYGKYSTRGPSELTNDKENKTTGLDRDYITDWSYGIGETFTLFVPDFKGGASEPISRNNKDALNGINGEFKQYVGSFGAYFGDQPFTGGPYYMGAILILLFVIGIFIVEGPIKWWLVGATTLSILLSWGKYFMWFTNLFLDFAPGYDKFRAVTMNLSVTAFTIPVLAMLAVNKMITEKDVFMKYKKKIMYAMGVVVGLALLITIAPGMFTNFYTQREYERVEQSLKGQQNSPELLDQIFSAVSTAREHIVKSDAMRTFVLVLITAILIWSFLRYRFNVIAFIAGIGFLILVDLAPVGRRYMASDDYVKKSAIKIPFPETTADQYILNDKTGSFRVLNLAVSTFNDASTSYYHQSIGGYHGAKLKRYKEVIDSCLLSEVEMLRMVLQKQDSAMIQMAFSQPVINMLNTKYFIYNADAPPLENAGRLGNAWFVKNMKVVPNADSEIVALKNLDPSSIALVDQRFMEKLSGFSFPSPDTTSTISLAEYKPNHLTYKSNTQSEQLAVFSEIYYDKGWNAYVDGKPGDYIRANYILRAMRVPAGSHTIEYKFEPGVIGVGEKISLASSLLLLIGVAVAIFMELKGKKQS